MPKNCFFELSFFLFLGFIIILFLTKFLCFFLQILYFFFTHQFNAGGILANIFFILSSIYTTFCLFIHFRPFHTSRFFFFNYFKLVYVVWMITFLFFHRNYQQKVYYSSIWKHFEFYHQFFLSCFMFDSSFSL